LAANINTLNGAVVLKPTTEAHVNTLNGAAVIRPAAGMRINTLNGASILRKPLGSNVHTLNGAVVLKTPDCKFAIINGDAETGDLTGWTVTYGDPDVDNYVTPYEGSYYFFVKTSATASMEQIIDIPAGCLSDITTGDYGVVVSFHQYTYNTVRDRLQIEVEALDNSLNVLHSKASYMTSSPIYWLGKSLIVPLPSTATKIKLKINWERGLTGTNTDGYIDKIEAYVIKVPYNSPMENGGAEAGQMTGWELCTGTADVDNSLAANSGAYYFKLKAEDQYVKYSRINQFIEFTASEKAIIASGGASLDVSVYAKVGNLNDKYRAKYHVYDSNGLMVNTESTSYDANLNWTQIVFPTYALPSNAARIEILLDGSLDASGNLGTLFDDFTYQITQTVVPAERNRKHLSYAALLRSSVVRHRVHSSYAILKKNPVITVRDTCVNVLIKRGSAQRNFSHSGYAIIHYIEEMRDRKGVSYSVLGDPYAYVHKQLLLVPQSRSVLAETLMQFSNVAVGKNLQAETTMQFINVVINPPQPRTFVKSYNNTTYAILLEPQFPPLYAKTYSYTTYATIKYPERLRERKTAGYMIWYTSPVARGIKMLSYGVIRPSLEQLRLKDYDNYALLKFEGDIKDRKVASYAVITKMPPVKNIKINGYGLIVAVGYVKNRKGVAYALLDIDIVRDKKHSGYAILEHVKTRLHSSTSYMLMYADKIFSLDKNASYGVLQYQELPTKMRKGDTYALINPGPEIVRHRTHKTYVVIGEKQPVVDTIKFSAYLCLGTYPENTVMYKEHSSYVIFEGQYNRTWKATSYTVLYEIPVKFVKGYKIHGYAIMGVPPETLNTTFNKLTGYVR
jgi:hypothetical protein